MNRIFKFLLVSGIAFAMALFVSCSQEELDELAGNLQSKNEQSSSSLETQSSSSDLPLCEDKEYNPETHYCYLNECGRLKSCDDAVDNCLAAGRSAIDCMIACPTVCSPRMEIREIEKSICCQSPTCPMCDVCVEPLEFEYENDDCTKDKYVYCPMMIDEDGECISNSNQIPPGGGCHRECGKGEESTVCYARPHWFGLERECGWPLHN